MMKRASFSLATGYCAGIQIQTLWQGCFRSHSYRLQQLNRNITKKFLNTCRHRQSFHISVFKSGEVPRTEWQHQVVFLLHLYIIHSSSFTKPLLESRINFNKHKIFTQSGYGIVHNIAKACFSVLHHGSCSTFCTFGHFRRDI